MNKLPHILVVDDEEGITSLVREALEVTGLTVLTANNGREGLDLYRANSDVGVILTDLMMPEMNGMELLAEVKQIDSYVEVIVLTGYGSLENALEALKKGAYDYLLKPVSLEQLTHTVRRAMERRLLYMENVRHQKRLERLVKEQAQHNRKLQQTLAELNETQEQLIQSEKLASLGQLASGMAHEINNPIGYIHSNLATLTKYAGRVKQAFEFIRDETRRINHQELNEKIEKTWKKDKLDFILKDLDQVLKESLSGTERVKQIIDDLSTFSRTAPVKHVKSDLIRGLDSTLNIVAGNLHQKAELIKDFEELPSVRCNLHHISQVFLNLILNSMQSIKDPPGKITIRTRNLEGNRVSVEVEDNGVGIAPSDINRIFDPFYTTKEVGEGVGLGLSVSYRIIKDHGGEIEVNSEQNVGTAVKLILPVEGLGEKDEEAG